MLIVVFMMRIVVLVSIVGWLVIFFSRDGKMKVVIIELFLNVVSVYVILILFRLKCVFMSIIVFMIIIVLVVEMVRLIVSRFCR